MTVSIKFLMALSFQDELPNIVDVFAEFKNHSREQLATAAQLDETQFSDNFDTIEHSPRAQVRMPHRSAAAECRHHFQLFILLQMLQRIRKVQYTGDPSILPACSNEIAPLVRLQYRLAHYLNQNVRISTVTKLHSRLTDFLSIPKYSRELENYYERTDVVGIVARHILDAPRTIQTFEKSNGVSRLIESRLGPRINLRWMASYRTQSIIAFSLIIGKLLFGQPIFGLFVLICIKFLTIFVASTYELLSSY